jgi:hypothetical protein
MEMTQLLTGVLSSGHGGNFKLRVIGNQAQ